jgi:uncharacterized membrane protein
MQYPGMHNMANTEPRYRGPLDVECFFLLIALAGFFWYLFATLVTSIDWSSGFLVFITVVVFFVALSCSFLAFGCIAH